MEGQNKKWDKEHAKDAKEAKTSPKHSLEFGALTEVITQAWMCVQELDGRLTRYDGRIKSMSIYGNNH